jgi:3-methyladenine DNA glycosylase/8-oxoguanine DNA glycosylase
LTARVRLPARFSFDAVVRSHGWYDLPPFSYDRGKATLETTVDAGAFAGGAARAAAVTFRRRGETLEASGDLPAASLRAIARRVFALDLDLSSAQASFAAAPPIARALEQRGGRMLHAPTLFEDAVKMLFTTNCSWGATRGMVVRLIEIAGAGRRAFPGPEQVAALSIATLKRRVRCGYRAEALRLFARRIATKRLDLAAWEDPSRSSEELRSAIASERGFGPYSAEGLLRILGRHDFFALDSWTRQQYRRLYPGPGAATDRAITRRYGRFGAHRGLALWLDMTRGWHQEGPPDWPATGAGSALQNPT